MRGPTIRLKYDVRRHWKCPECGAERRVSATETAIRCVCSSGVQMKLVETQRYVRATPEPIDFVLTEEDCDRFDGIDPASSAIEENKTEGNRTEAAPTPPEVTSATANLSEDAPREP